MSTSEKLEDWYNQKFDSVPEKKQVEHEHFDVLKLDPFLGDDPAPVPYDQRDYYKIMLFRGKSTVLYADKVLEVNQQALSFSNPLIPCKWIDQEEVKAACSAYLMNRFLASLQTLVPTRCFSRTETTYLSCQTSS